MESTTQTPAEFDAQLRELTPRLLALPVLTLLCVVVWIASVTLGGMDWLHPKAQELLSWGANSTAAVQSGQWWRLLSSMFLHAGVVHLVVNMLALWQAGVLVSRLHGNRGFTIIYFGSGLVGSALSLHFAASSGVAVGASGAVFGVTGALLASVVQHWRDIPIARSKPLVLGLGFFIIYSFWAGLTSKGVDNAAHAGGLLVGFACGWFMAEKTDVAVSAAARQSRLALSAALCGLVALAGVMTAGSRVEKTDVAFNKLTDAVDAKTNATLSTNVNARSWPELRLQLARVVSAAQQDAQLHQAGKLQTSSFLEHLKATHVPALRGMETKLAMVGSGGAAPRFCTVVMKSFSSHSRWPMTSVTGRF